MKNITKRRRADWRLAECKEHYRSLFEHHPDAVCSLDPGGRFTSINDAGVAMTGYSRENLLGEIFDAITAPEYLEKSRKHFAEALHGKPQNYESAVIAKDGRKIFITVTNMPIIVNDRIFGVYGIARDISAKKLAEEKLIQTEKQYRGIIENILDIYYRCDRDGRVIMISPSGVSLLGYRSEADVIGRNVADVFYFNAEERNKVLSALEDRGFIRDYEVTLRHRDGMAIPVSTSSRCYYDGKGNILGIEGIYRDIRERKQSEKALQESNEKYKQLFELISDAIFLIDNETGRILEVNIAASSLYGYTHDELLEMRHTDLSAEPSETRKVTLAGETFVPIRWHRKKDGTVFPVEIGARHIRWKGCVAHIAAIRDVTEREKAEEERNRVEEEKRRLEERLHQSEKMEALGTMAGGVAHDLNNMLGVVIGYAELLLINADESGPIRSSLTNVMKGAQRAAAIVDDLLTLTRRGVSERQVLNLNKIIADSQQLPEFEKLYSYHPSATIRTDLEPDLLNISGSAVHLRKTLFNLVSNANEAMPKGGVVTIRTANQYLDRPIQGYDEVREGDYVVLSVSDTGEGIPAGNLKRIFEPFYTKKVMGRSGTGLGLTVVWGTVKDHHGYINIQSEEGSGTVFTLYFPVTRENISMEDTSVAITDYMGSSESILIVDDVKEQRDLAAGMLKILNYNVSSVPSGEKAIAYLKDCSVDLMVLDMIMDPGMDGLDTYRRVLDIRPNQKAILVSGFSESDRVREAQALGAGAYVKKPYVIEKLGLAVRKELNRE